MCFFVWKKVFVVKGMKFTLPEPIFFQNNLQRDHCLMSKQWKVIVFFDQSMAEKLGFEDAVFFADCWHMTDFLLRKRLDQHV